MEQGLIGVYGASGTTGRFVLAELARRGLPAVAIGRRAGPAAAGAAWRVAALDDDDSLLRALQGVQVLIHCAGPFLDTAAPMLAAALRVGCSYIDVTAEQGSAQDTLQAWDAAARQAGVTVIPAAGFYGGLADLMATALLGGEPADELTVAIGLNRWWPTEGTRRTGRRNTVPRVVIEGGRLVPVDTAPPAPSCWHFGAALGEQSLTAVPFSEVITIAHHLPVQRLRTGLSSAALQDLRDASTPPPTPVDEHGRSAQRFVMDVQAAQRGWRRHLRVQGQDIYAVTAPLVVEAAVRLQQAGATGGGCRTLGEAFDAGEFLSTLAPRHLSVERLD